MAQATLIEQLADLQFSTEFPAAVLQALSGIAKERTFDPGAFLCREDERISDLFLIVRGHVGVEMLVPGRGQVRVLTLGPGELLGWSAIVGDHGATATGIAIEETHAIVIPSESLLSLCQTDFEVGYLVMRQLAKTISQRLDATRLQLLDLFATESPKVEFWHASHIHYRANLRDG